MRGNVALALVCGICAAVTSSLVVNATVGASTAQQRERNIGGALCRPVTSGGVICQWPNKPFAVGITKQLALVWWKNRVQFARTNR